MNFSGKIFCWFYALIIVVVVLVALVAGHAAKSRLTHEYTNRYRSLGGALAVSFTQMEALGERVALDALYVLREVEARSGLPSDPDLDEMAHRLGVTSFYITDELGRFIRSSDTPLAHQTASIFGFCEGYQSLLTGESTIEVTPIVPGNPNPRPTKFVSISNATSSRILETSYDLEFVGQTLAKVVQDDEDVSSAALFSPNGLLLGEMGPSGKLHWKNRDKPFVPWFGAQVGPDMTEFSIRVPASTKNCCECRIEGVARENINYYYILRLRVSSATLVNDLFRAQLAIGGVAAAVAVVAAIVAHVLAKQLVGGLTHIEATATAIITKGSLTERVDLPSGQDEIFRLARTFNIMMQSLEEAMSRSVETERLATIERVASQVAHDIRSPLAAVKMVTTNLSQIPEEARCLMRSAVFRIEDIVNHLLLVRRGHHSEIIEVDRHLTSDLVETLVSEKRTEYRSQLGISIETHVHPSAYGAFIQVDSTQFKSIVSNLINNAVEALEDQRGHVAVSVRLEELHVIVEVQDDGRGISEEILARLGKAEVSFGKEGGNGIGVAAAKRAIEIWGGELEYESVISEGTAARIRLPIMSAPGWFCPELILQANATVVVIDDDVSIHHIWSERLEGLAGINIVNLSTPDGFAAYMHTSGQSPPTLFLMDHELLGFDEDGLDLVESYGVGERAILVTSRAQEPSVRARAEAMGVRIVPKSAAPHIPVRHMAVAQDGRQPIVLIDDDHLVRRIWIAIAGEHDKTVYAFESLSEFLKVADGVELSTSIYIDIHLANGERGDKGAEILHHRGFANIYYATGDELRPEDVPPWIVGICGKAGPFCRE